MAWIRINTFLILLFSMLLTTGCGIYTFTGKIPSDVKTISVAQFTNDAPMVVASLSQDFTEKLRDKYQSSTSLTLVSANGDWQVQGSIRNYQVTPLAITGNETAAQSRLTVGIDVTLTDTKHPENNWKQTFSQFADFPASSSLSAVETQLLEEITEKLVQDVFTRSVSNW